jgi:CubicO group peptidase (beta-lactamase class C family)
VNLLIASLAAIVATVAAGSSAQLDEPGIRRYVAVHVKMHDFSGVVMAVHQGRVGFAEAFGTADLASGVANTPSTRFLVGSISKTFTAAAIELLVKHGRIRYSDSLAKYVPEYNQAKKITIRELLEHSAGVPDYYGISAFARDRRKNLSLGELARWLNAYALDFAPGSRNSYSNSGYSLLALVIERASGQRYARYLSNSIFGPLGLHHTGDAASGTPTALAKGYDPAPAPAYLKLADAIAIGWLEGNGSIYSTADDLSRWLTVAQRGEYLNFKSLPYPFGWGLDRAGTHTLLEQDGRIPGYAAFVSIDEKSGDKTIVLGNVQSAVVDVIASEVRAAEAGQPLTTPQERPSFVPSLGALNRFTGSYETGPVKLTVVLSGNTLFIVNQDGSRLPLDPISSDRFFFRPLFVYVGFKADSHGSVTAMDWNNGQFSIPKR